MIEPALTIAEIASALRRSTRTIRRRCIDGTYPRAFLDGREWRVPQSDVLAEQERGRTPKARPHDPADEIAERILRSVA